MGPASSLLSIVGTKIEMAASILSGVDANTAQKEYRFFLQLSDKRIVELLIGEVRICKSLPAGSARAQLQAFDGMSDVCGEQIVSIIEKPESAWDQSIVAPASRREKTQKFQIAIVLSSGRAVRALPRCGGGNVLQAESVAALQRSSGAGWVELSETAL